MAVSIPGASLLPPSSPAAVSAALGPLVGKQRSSFPRILQQPVSDWPELGHVPVRGPMPVSGELHWAAADIQGLKEASPIQATQPRAGGVGWRPKGDGVFTAIQVGTMDAEPCKQQASRRAQGRGRESDFIVEPHFGLNPINSQTSCPWDFSFSGASGICEEGKGTIAPGGGQQGKPQSFNFSYFS